MSYDDVNQAAFHALQRLHMMKCAVIYVEKQIRIRLEKQINWSQDENLFERINLQKFWQLIHGLYPLLQ